MTKRSVPVDVVAASYVELTVAIVTLEQRIEHLEAQLGRILATLETQILAEQLAAIEAFKAAKGLR